MADKQTMAQFSIERNDREFHVRFTPIKSGWWNVAIIEGNHPIHNCQRNFPANFTNAAKVLDEIIASKKKKRSKKHKFRVVG